MGVKEKKKIGRVLILIALAFTMLGYVTIKKGETIEWLFYLAAGLGIIGLIISLSKNK